MKAFLVYTSIIEALTGLGLLLIPVPLISFLFGSPLTGQDGKIVSMIAGAAILSLALLCYLLREESTAQKAISILLVYNLLLSLIFLYGIISRALTGPGCWLVLIFHSFQTIVSLSVLRKKNQFIKKTLI
jgi:O-antigen/teichoic acid export membrane protein